MKIMTDGARAICRHPLFFGGGLDHIVQLEDLLKLAATGAWPER
jgi:hypothetical protein